MAWVTWVKKGYHGSNGIGLLRKEIKEKKKANKWRKVDSGFKHAANLSANDRMNFSTFHCPHYRCQGYLLSALYQERQIHPEHHPWYFFLHNWPCRPFWKLRVEHLICNFILWWGVEIILLIFLTNFSNSLNFQPQTESTVIGCCLVCNFFLRKMRFCWTVIYIVDEDKMLVVYF